MHSAMLHYQIENHRAMCIVGQERPNVPHLDTTPFPVYAFAENGQLCMNKPLPNGAQLKRMGRAPFMDVCGMTSIIGLAALNGVTNEAFVQSSLWDQNILSVI